MYIGHSKAYEDESVSHVLRFIQDGNDKIKQGLPVLDATASCAYGHHQAPCSKSADGTGDGSQMQPNAWVHTCFCQTLAQLIISCGTDAPTATSAWLAVRICHSSAQATMLGTNNIPTSVLDATCHDSCSSSTERSYVCVAAMHKVIA